MTVLPRLYAVADRTYGDPVVLAAALFDGGARLVQVRNKSASGRDFLKEVDAIVHLAPPGARVLVNDRCDVAWLSGAAGVHVGQGDLDPEAVRRVVGPGALLGWSTHTLDQALLADRSPADYVAVGPVFATATKPDSEPVVGLQDLRRICQAVSKPVVAIGGITLDRARDVIDCGVASLAVIGDLLDRGDVSARTRSWLTVLGAQPGASG